MKAYQFLKKFLYTASDIHRVYIHPNNVTKPDGVELLPGEVLDPTNKDHPHNDLLSATLSSFRIRNGSLIIYVK